MKNIMFCLVLIVVIAGCTAKSASQVPENKVSDAVPGPNTAPVANTGSPADETISSPGQISIDITAKGFSNGVLSFDTAFNTHSGSLAELDLMNSIILEANQKTYLPASVPVLTGHHTSGSLTFAIETQPTSYIIVIKNVPDVPERTFSFGGQK